MVFKVNDKIYSNVSDPDGYVKKAYDIAVKAHAKSINSKNGEPCISHAMRVASMVENIPVYKIVAFLHDVVEDTDTCISDIEKEFDSQFIAPAVQAITRNKNEDYFDYIRRVKRNEIARQVKVADLIDNMNLNRLHEITILDAKRQSKYALALEILLFD